MLIVAIMELRILLITLLIFFIVGNADCGRSFSRSRTSSSSRTSSRTASRSKPASHPVYRPKTPKPVSRPVYRPTTPKPVPRPVYRPTTPKPESRLVSNSVSSKPTQRPVQNTHTGNGRTTNQGNQHATNNFLLGERGGHSANGVHSTNHHVNPQKSTAPVNDPYAGASAPPLQNNEYQQFGNPGFRNPAYGVPPHNNQKSNMAGSASAPNGHPVIPPYPPNGHPIGMPHPNNGRPIQPNIGFDHQQPSIGHVNQPFGPYARQPAGNPYVPRYNPPYPTQSHGTPHQTIGQSHPHSVGNPNYANPTGNFHSPHPYGVQAAHPYGVQPAHPYGVPPAQTVYVVPAQQSSNNGGGFGQLVKEALIFSSVNAAVNRVINPPHYHSHYQDNGLSRPISGTSNAATTSTTSNTQITYNNQYFNQPPPGSNGSGAVASGTVNTNVPDGTGAYPNGAAPGDPTVNQGNGNPIGSRNAFENIPGSRGVGTADQNIANNNTSVSLANGTGMTGPNVITASQTNGTANNSVPNQGNQETDPNLVNRIEYTISDEMLWKLTEDLFAKDDNDAYKYITLNLQNQTEGNSTSDTAANPLLSVRSEAYSIPTIQVIRSLYDNHEFDGQVKEKVTVDQRKEENLLLDIFLDTRVMATAMRFLTSQHLIEDDPYAHKDTLKRIWFSPYDGSTSGFERVFMGELYGNTTIFGVQDWIYFDAEESAKRADYLGYIHKVDLGSNAALVKMNFKLNNIVRPEATIFVGTSPELEMALYTVCFLARPNDICPVSLGGTKFIIYTSSYRYFGKDLMYFALPYIKVVQ